MPLSISETLGQIMIFSSFLKGVVEINIHQQNHWWKYYRPHKWYWMISPGKKPAYPGQLNFYNQCLWRSHTMFCGICSTLPGRHSWYGDTWVKMFYLLYRIIYNARSLQTENQRAYSKCLF